jgi:hypothetical protein
MIRIMSLSAIYKTRFLDIFIFPNENLEKEAEFGFVQTLVILTYHTQLQV